MVITGCSSGFGRQMSEQLARGGDRVYATMRGADGVNSEVVRELNDLAAKDRLDLRVVELDVRSTHSAEAAAAKVLEESGAPDVVINNAGQMFVGLTEAFSDVELLNQLDINVAGIHRVGRAFLPAMRRRGKGLMINISSTAGRMGMPFFGVYHASKWAVEGYSTALRGELASSGVDVVLVEPGPFPTDLLIKGPQPEDSDSRAATYPAEAQQVFEQMGSAFEDIFNNPDAPTDPGLVVKRVQELMDMAPGSRPLRSVVGIDFGVRALNEASAPHEAAQLEMLGLKEFTSLRPGDGNE